MNSKSAVRISGVLNVLACLVRKDPSNVKHGDAVIPGPTVPRGQLEFHYGIRAPKTIFGMFVGT